MCVTGDGQAGDTFHGHGHGWWPELLALLFLLLGKSVDPCRVASILKEMRKKQEQRAFRGMLCPQSFSYIISKQKDYTFGNEVWPDGRM